MLPRLMIRALFLIATLAFTACSTSPYKKTNRLYKAQAKTLGKEIAATLPAPYQTNSNQHTSKAEAVLTSPVATIHFNLRKPNFVILHHTAQDSLNQTLYTFTVPHTEVSAHYVISKTGLIVQMANDYFRTWHAGAGKWGSLSDLNSVSLGIELDNNGNEPFSEEQISSLLSLLDTLKKKYNIPSPNFIAHSDIAPTRKQDPSVFFPWKRLADQGFGLWQDDLLEEPPINFNPEDALKIIGYDTSDLPAAIIAFKRHFIQNDLSPKLSDQELRILYNLYKKH